MTAITVAGFDTVSIHAARDAAGVGGTVYFPNGPYSVDGLTASVAMQTWQLDRMAVLKRSDTAISNGVLTLTAPGLRVRGGTLDGNRAVNPNTACGIVAPGNGCDLDLCDTVIQNTRSWGIAVDNCALIMDRVTIRATTLAGLIWRSTMGSGREGPQIDRCLVDRSAEPAATIQSGGILIQSTDTRAQFVLQPRITRSRIVLPVTSADNADCLELLYCQRATIEDNVITGGRIGMTYGQSGLGWLAGNKLQVQTSYAIELGCNDTIIEGNVGTGYVPSLYGITANPVTTSSKAIGNTMRGYSIPIQIGSGAVLESIGND